MLKAFYFDFHSAYNGIFANFRSWKKQQFAVWYPPNMCTGCQPALKINPWVIVQMLTQNVWNNWKVFETKNCLFSMRWGCSTADFFPGPSNIITSLWEMLVIWIYRTYKCSTCIWWTNKLFWCREKMRKCTRMPFIFQNPNFAVCGSVVYLGYLVPLPWCTKACVRVR